MMKATLRVMGRLADDTLLNPWAWVRCAGMVIALFVLFHLLGWRPDTAVISGTVDASRGPVRWVMWRGTLYALTYFGAVVVSPALLLAAGVYAALARRGGSRQP